MTTRQHEYVGVDVSKETLEIGSCAERQTEEVANNKKLIAELVQQWSGRSPKRIVMEALVLALFESGLPEALVRLQ